jgi:hypothetical protein
VSFLQSMLKVQPEPPTHHNPLILLLFYLLFILLSTDARCMWKDDVRAPSAQTKIPMSFVPGILFAESTPCSGRAALRRRRGMSASLANGREVEISWSVSYNMYLLLKYTCHINVVVCTSVNLQGWESCYGRNWCTWSKRAT